MPTLQIAIAGARGRVGQLLTSSIADAPDLRLAATLTRDDTTLPACDVLIDFSSPAGFRHWLNTCRAARIPFISGTTGLGEEDYALLDAAAEEIPVLHATNTSLGVAVLNRLAAEATRLLGEAFDIEIVEMHHRHKRDAPSGTAETLAEHVLAARGVSKDALAFGRHGMDPRQPGSIGMHSLRGGDVVGEHTVHLAGPGERLFIGHAATSRETFAQGALRAARWLITRTPGRYGMTDVLGV